MNYEDKTKEELIQELQAMQKNVDELKSSYDFAIDGRIRIEKALKESEDRLKDIVFSMADWVWEVDQNGVYTYSSHKSIDFFGQTRDYLIGRTPFDFMLPAEARRVGAIFSEIVKNKEPIKDLENWSIGKNGNKTCLLTNAVPILDEDGNLKGYRGVDKDITERKQAEELLVQIQTNYETFFNTIDDFLYVLDEQGNIIHTNTTVTGRLGYTRDELIGKAVLLVHPPERREEAGKIVSEMLLGITEFCPIPVMTKSGIQIPVETRVNSGVWNGKPAIFGVSKDISKIKLSEEKFSKLFHINPFACGLSDLEDGKYIEVNDVFYALLGFEKDEVMGHTAFELGILTPKTAKAVLKKADANGKVVDGEADLKAKNGEIKHVLLSAENIYIQDKKYRFTVVHDVTERKQAEKILHEANKKMEAMILASPDGVGIASLNGKVSLVSDNLYSMYGYPLDKKEELLGRNVFEFIDASSHEKLKENITKVISGTDKTISEYLAIKKDGTRFFVEINSAILRNSVGEPVEILFVERDVTERKRAENALKLKSEELFKANAEKDKFFSIIAHDLRSPFQTLLGYTRMMVENLPNLKLDEIQLMASEMRNSANKLLNLLENLLQWSQMQRGIGGFEPQSFSLMDGIGPVIELVLEAAEKKTIRIINHVTEDMRITADPKMFESIMRNLVFNAIKFTPKGGTIDITARAINGNAVEISVRDNGIGMNIKMIERLFRLDELIISKGTDGESGTGLGLIIFKDFVEKHGGKVWVESEENVGSVFSFTIPF